MQTLLMVMIINLVVLSLVLVIFLAALVVVLFMLRNTLLKVQKAVDTVERSALIPLLSLRTMFSDFEGFVASARAWANLFTRKKKSSKE